MRISILLFLLCGSGLLKAQSENISTKKGDLTITPIIHSTMVMQWNGRTIFLDPYGGAEKFEEFSPPDLVLITDVHGDHLNQETLAGLDLSKATLIAPTAVTQKVEDLQFRKVRTLANGEQITWKGIKIEALPMYNLPETEDSRHPKGRGNGYVLTIGGKRVYLSGDTEDIPEMRALENIDAAFICVNLPYTMDIEQAAGAVLDFQPNVVYPFHYRGGGGKFSDVEAFKKLVQSKNPDIEVRLLDWYPAE